MKFIALSSLAMTAITIAGAQSVPYFNTTLNSTNPFSPIIFNTTGACIVLVGPNNGTPNATFSSSFPNATSFSSSFPNATFSGTNLPNATFTGKLPNATLSGNIPNATFSGNLPNATLSGRNMPNETFTFTGNAPNATFSGILTPNATFSTFAPTPNATVFSSSGGFNFTTSTVITANATITGTIVMPSPGVISTVFAPSVSTQFNVSELPLCSPTNAFAPGPQNTSAGVGQLNTSGAPSMTIGVGALVLSMVAGLLVSL